MLSSFIRRSFIIFILFFFSSNLFAQSVWQSANAGLNGKISIRSIAINPQNPNEMYAGLAMGGLYKTYLGGDNWQEIHKELFEGAQIGSILIHPKNVDIVYLSSDKKGVFKSTDGGKNWVSINQGLPVKDAIIKQLVMNPKNPDELYAVSLFHGIFKTTNGGNNWVQSGSTLSASYFIQLDISPANPNYLILTTYDDSIETQLYKSVDGGMNWQHLPQQNKFYVFTVRFAPDNPQVMYGIGNGFYQSIDGGLSWFLLREIPNDQDRVDEFLIDKKDPKIIYIYVQHEGFYKTTDGGKTWALISNALKESDEWMMLQQHPLLSNRLYFSSEEYGFAQSNDGGEHWHLTDNGIFNANINALATDPQNPDVAYAGNEKGLWIMRDGKTWTLAQQFAGRNVYTIVVDPNNSSHILTIATDENDKHKLAIYVSTNNGISWQHATASGRLFDELAPNMLAFNPNNTQEVYITEFFGDIWKSNDGGISWFQWSRLSDIAMVNTIAINPKNSQEIFVGAERQGNNLLFRSMDSGKTWQNLTSKLAPKQPLKFNDSVFSLRYDPIQANVIYAIARVQDTVHLYKSSDAGNSWQTVDSDGLQNLFSLSSLLFNPNNVKTLYASAGECRQSWCDNMGEGILASFDGGIHWQANNTGLYNTSTMTLAINKTSLWTGTEGSGVFKLEI